MTDVRFTFAGDHLEPPWRTHLPGYGLGVERYVTDPDVVKVAGGCLQITATRDPDGTWRSGWVTTQHALHVEHGRSEARIKLPTGQGIWPAFWLADYEPSGTSEPGPFNAELDIVETINAGTTLYGTAHNWAGTHWGKGITAPLKPGWHVYGLDWTADTLTWLLDGNPVGVLHKADLATWPFDRPLYLILNVAVGGGWAGAPDTSTPARAAMLVDWVSLTF